MKNIFIQIIIVCLLTYVAKGQTYLISQEGTVSTCGGMFYDSGGSSGNYGDNENYTITFCSSNNSRIRVTFTSMNLASGDYLYVYYGNTVTATPNLTNPGTGTITSSCDCITIRFISDNKTTRAGWVGAVACLTPTVVVNDYIFNATIPPLDGTCLAGQTNIGATSDYGAGCFTGTNTVWYDVSLDPENNTLNVTMQNVTFPDGQVQYFLLFNECGNLYYYPSSSIQCGSASNTYQWTDLREGQYYLGINTSAANVGNFDLCVTQSWIDHCGDYYCGSTETCNTCPFDCGACPESYGGPYFHPSVGIQSTYLGQCMVSTCSGKYYDNGGPGATYANNINQIYRTFCPSSPNMAVRATISQMQIEYQPSPAACLDRLIINNGPTQNSPTIWSGCGNTSIPQILTTGGSYNSGVFTSTHPSGCLTFRFQSEASNSGYWEGWDIDLSCVPFPTGNPGTYNNDCSSAIPICSDVTVSSQLYGPGQSSDGCGGCVTSENFTEWYYLVLATGGTVELSINPVGNSDMDFALYRADDCGNLGMPVRCSFAVYAPPGKTGLTKGAGDLSEDVTGDQWVSELNVNAGERYYIMINEWNKLNPNSYSLAWTLSNGASFDCGIVLPVELLNFKADCHDNGTRIKWETASEMNNHYFTLERSLNGLNFETIAITEGAGTTNEIRKYTYNDTRFASTVYYRLTQTDYDGSSKTFDVISATCNNNRQFSMSVGDNSDEGFMNIIHDSEAGITYLLTIIDSQGKTVYAKQYSTEGEVINERIETRNYTSGIYFINITSSVNNHSQKIWIR